MFRFDRVQRETRRAFIGSRGTLEGPPLYAKAETHITGYTNTDQNLHRLSLTAKRKSKLGHRPSTETGGLQNATICFVTEDEKDQHRLMDK